MATARGLWQGLTYAGGLIYGNYDLDSSRLAVFNGQSDILTRSTSASSFGGFARVRYPLLEEGGMLLSANGAVDLWRASIDAAEETPGNQLSLSVADSTVSGGRLEAGVDVQSADPVVALGMDIHPYAKIGFRHTMAFDGREFDASFANGSGPTITLNGDDSAYLQGYIGAGTEIDLTDRVDAYIHYDYGFSGELRNHGLTTGLRVSF